MKNFYLRHVIFIQHFLSCHNLLSHQRLPVDQNYPQLLAVHNAKEEHVIVVCYHPFHLQELCLFHELIAENHEAISSITRLSIGTIPLIFNCDIFVTSC